MTRPKTLRGLLIQEIIRVHDLIDSAVSPGELVEMVKAQGVLVQTWTTLVNNGWNANLDAKSHQEENGCLFPTTGQSAGIE